MNILKQNPRRSTVRKVHWDNLDDRIVPSTVQPMVPAAHAVAAAHANVNATASAEGSATADSTLQTRRENRIIKLEERREAAKDRREARLEKLAAAHRFSPATMVETPAAFAAAIAGARQSSHAPGSSSTGGTAISGSNTGSTSTGTTVTTTPVTTSPVTTTPVTTSPGSGTSSTGTGSTGTGTTSTSPLPDNVSTVLDTIYEEFQSGTLPTSTQPGQVEIQGSNVGVQIRVSDSADFAAALAQAQSLGMQVTTSSAAYGMIDGFLPISALPAAAQLPGTPAIAPELYPTTN